MERQDVQAAEDAQARGRRWRIPWWGIVRGVAIGLVVGLFAIQLYPYGRDHSNPPVAQAIQWDSPRTEELARRACYDCHSNETDWPWYSNIAPVSWLIQRDVDLGRSELNFSEPNGLHEAGESAESVREGDMPLWFYGITHPDARLTDQEKQELINGFIATFGAGEEGDDD